MTTALSFVGTRVARGRHVIVDRASFQVSQGQVHALLGHNGAGKTTLMRALAGLVPYTGAIEMTHEPEVLFVGGRYPADVSVSRILTHQALHPPGVATGSPA